MDAAASGPLLVGRPIHIAVARMGAEAMSCTVQPLTGNDEAAIAEARNKSGGRHGRPLPPIAIQSLILSHAVAELGGKPPAPEALDALTVGDRNRLVLATLSATYGAPDAVVGECSEPDCRTMTDLPIDLETFLLTTPVSPMPPAGHPVTLALADARAVIRFRLPTGGDIAASLDPDDDPQSAARRLVDGCVVSVGRLDAARRARHAAEIAEAVEAAMETLDPMAEIVLGSRCPGCGGALNGVLDPLALLIAEMDSYGGIFVEVARLAAICHWSEGDILALAAARRRRYLAIVDAATRASTGERTAP